MSKVTPCQQANKKSIGCLGVNRLIISTRKICNTDNDLFELVWSQVIASQKYYFSIPLTGFIGTVIGMSQAVGSFDVVLSNADNVDGLEDGLVQVTGGLGTAFDTTFLACIFGDIGISIICLRKERRQLLKSMGGA